MHHSTEQGKVNKPIKKHHPGLSPNSKLIYLNVTFKREENSPHSIAVTLGNVDTKKTLASDKHLDAIKKK